MNWRKHMVLMVGGGLAVILLLAALVVLVRFQGRYGATTRELESAQQRLQQLTGRVPFPSVDNVEKTKQNRDALLTAAVQLQDLMQRSQITGTNMEPAEFAPLLERTSRRMQQKAQEAGVSLPAGFAFGFPRYAAGELPSAESVHRLVGQLRAVEAVCDVLFQARVSQINGLERDLFDESTVATENQPQDNRRSRRAVSESAPVASSVPKVETNELYDVERIVVSFQGRETAVWDALNGVVHNPAFMVMADVKLDNQLAVAGTLGKKQPVAPIGGEKAGTALASQYPSHDERIVSGRENVLASLVIDLYHFHNAFKPEEKP